MVTMSREFKDNQQVTKHKIGLNKKDQPCYVVGTPETIRSLIFDLLSKNLKFSPEGKVWKTFVDRW